MVLSLEITLDLFEGDFQGDEERLHLEESFEALVPADRLVDRIFWRGDGGIDGCWLFLTRAADGARGEGMTSKTTYGTEPHSLSGKVTISTAEAGKVFSLEKDGLEIALFSSRWISKSYSTLGATKDASRASASLSL